MMVESDPQAGRSRDRKHREVEPMLGLGWCAALTTRISTRERDRVEQSSQSGVGAPHTDMCPGLVIPTLQLPSK